MRPRSRWTDVLVGLWCILFLSFCSRPQDMPTSSGSVASQRDSSSHVDAGSQAEDAAAPSSPGAREPIGLDDVASRLNISAAAKSHNRGALKKHRSGDYGAAIAGFQKALDLDPHYDLARFNLACALSKAGKLAQSAEALRPLLLGALPRFKGRLEDDPDLASLRAATEGKALTKLAADLGQRWRDALAHGTPVVATMVTETEPTPETVVRRTVVWPGVYVHKARRFVPMTDRIERRAKLSVSYGAMESVSGFFDGPRGAIFLYAGGTPPWSIEVTKVDTHAPLAEGTKTMGAEDHDYGQIMGIQGAPTKAGPVVRIKNPEGWGPWLGLTGRAKAPAGMYVERSLWLGTLLFSPAPQGFAVKGNKLIAHGQPIELGRGHAASRHHNILVHPTAKVALVLSLRAAESTNRGVARHFLDRVDLEAKTTTRLADGDGLINIRLGPDGFLYAEIDGALKRRDILSASAEWEPTMDGIWLVVGGSICVFDGI